MERIAETSSLDLIRAANERFRNFFARFAGLPVEGSEEELRAMLQIERSLKSVGALLTRGIQASPAGDLQRELGEYRQNLLRLREELKRMESSATASRGRLFTREQHLQATRAWCDAARSTR